MKKTKNIKKKVSALLLLTLMLAACSLLLPACSQNGLYTEGSGELKVVCTNFPPFDLARQVGGERITLTLLQDSGADLHSYSPTANALTALTNADVFICIGGESDKKWVDDAVSSAQNPDLKVLYLIDGTELIHAELEEHGDDHGEENHGNEGDEHIWLSLKNASAITDKIKEAFSEKDPENAEYYLNSSNSFKEKLSALDAQYESAVASARTRTLVFADRFPFVYLTNDYGLSYYAAFSGCSTEINADFATQVKLINAVKDNSLSAVIVTEGSGKNLADNVCAETGCKRVALNSMQSVTRAEIENGATYLGIMTDNLASLREALS